MANPNTDRQAVCLIPDRGDEHWVILPRSWQALSSDRTCSTPAKWLTQLINGRSDGLLAEEHPLPSDLTDLLADGLAIEIVDWQSLFEYLIEWVSGK